VRRAKNGVAGRVTGAVAVSAALLVPLAIFGAPALARSGAAASQHGSASSQYQYRVVICHLTKSKKHPAHTIVVSNKAVPAHLRHGDHLGACTGTETPRPKKHENGKGKGHDEHATSPAQPAHGNDHGQGNDHGHGNGNGNGNGNGHHK
jgi:hypothetical protein